MKKSKLPKQALIILSIALVLVISTVMWSSAQITQDTEEEVQSTLRDVATQNALIVQQELREKLRTCTVTKVKNNMRNSLMSIADKILLRKRALIETVNDELKNIAQIEHSRHRSFSNFIANSLSAIAAYCFFEKKPAIDVKFVNDGQLAIF